MDRSTFDNQLLVQPTEEPTRFTVHDQTGFSKAEGTNEFGGGTIVSRDLSI